MPTTARRGIPALLVVLSLLLLGTALPAGGGPVEASSGAAWLAAQVNDAGFIPGPTDDPDVGATLEGALAIGIAGVEEDTYDRMVAWLQAEVEAVIAPYGTDNPGQLGYLLLLAHQAGVPAGSFGGVDLGARLAGTLGAYEPGLYGADDPTYDGAFRQSLALLGLQANGLAVPGAAAAWLADQQCDAPAGALGGWQAYRADTLAPCAAPDPDLFTGPDTNSTAMALAAAVATGGSADATAALGFLAAAQSADGGWPYIPGGVDDPNSTALVLVALATAGADPGAGPAALASWQLGCDADPLDRGAFASPYSDGFPDLIATRQGVWGIAGGAFPPPVASFGPAVDPCAPPTTSTTTGASPSTSVAPATVAPAVLTPVFTG